MTVRITSSNEPEPGTLQIDGWLSADVLPELARLCARADAEILLDLSGLRGLDAEAVAFLRRLRAEGARFIGVSDYMKLRLIEAADPDSHPSLQDPKV